MAKTVSFDGYGPDESRANAKLRAERKASTAEAFATLPADIQSLANRLWAIHDRYKLDATNADRPVGDNIRIGQLDSRIYRAIANHGLDPGKVSWIIAQYFSYNAPS